MPHPTPKIRDAEVAAVVYTRRNVRTQSHARAVLSAIQALPSELRLSSFAPDETSEPRDLQNDSSEFEAAWCGGVGDAQGSRFMILTSRRRVGPRALVAFATARRATYSSLTLTIPKGLPSPATDPLLAVAAGLFHAFDGEFGAVRSRGEFLDQHGDADGGASVVGVEFGALLPGIYFATLFDQSLVSTFPSGWSAGLPATAVHSLKSGGVLVQTAKTPHDWKSPDAIAARKRIREQIGASRFFDRGIAGVRGLGSPQ